MAPRLQQTLSKASPARGRCASRRNLMKAPARSRGRGRGSRPRRQCRTHTYRRGRPASPRPRPRTPPQKTPRRPAASHPATAAAPTRRGRTGSRTGILTPAARRSCRPRSRGTAGRGRKSRSTTGSPTRRARTLCQFESALRLFFDTTPALRHRGRCRRRIGRPERRHRCTSGSAIQSRPRPYSLGRGAPPR